MLLAAGADVNVRTLDGYGSALAAASFAASRCYATVVEVVRLLLDHGADPHAELNGRFGCALVASAAGGAANRDGGEQSAAVLELLLERGANPYTKSTGMYKNLYHAAASGHRGKNAGVAKLLAARGLSMCF